MNLIAEYMGINSECQLFSVISDTYLEGLIERSVITEEKDAASLKKYYF